MKSLKKRGGFSSMMQMGFYKLCENTYKNQVFFEKEKKHKL